MVGDEDLKWVIVGNLLISKVWEHCIYMIYYKGEGVL